jgi:hypothetical protein
MTCARSGLQVWGVIIGIGNQSFAEHWELVGAGTRAWEVCPPRLEHFLGLMSICNGTGGKSSSICQCTALSMGCRIVDCLGAAACQGSSVSAPAHAVQDLLLIINDVWCLPAEHRPHAAADGLPAHTAVCWCIRLGVAHCAPPDLVISAPGWCALR